MEIKIHFKNCTFMVLIAKTQHASRKWGFYKAPKKWRKDTSVVRWRINAFGGRFTMEVYNHAE